jgi:hypothetical protein
MLDSALDDVRDDLHVPVGVGRKARPPSDPVFVDDAQVPEPHVARVIVVGEAERVSAVKPAAKLAAAAFL